MTKNYDDVESDIFIAKLDANGTLIWEKKLGNGGFNAGNSIVVDNSDNIYVTGAFSNTVNFGSLSLSSVGNRDIFVSKLDTNGNFIWSKQLGGNASDQGRSIAVDSIGNVYTTGWFNGKY